ncbi:MAG: transcriptional repressor [Candidatus Cloacimonetes bacterium]|nr:transcriptional repressor [Candidatus Cloacimonadota bacterium]MBL7149318.1 transcriptional repressor [Candidatus Cloacimonadota bacterium]
MIDFIELLKEHGIPPSLQRIKILEYLHNFKTHPTADMIYQALVDEMPTLSKTTVYNTLKTFTEKGILVALSLFESEVRYEYNTEPHIHFKCFKCGKIYDISKTFECFKNEEIEGHKVLEHHINLKGICKSCLEKAKG